MQNADLVSPIVAVVELSDGTLLLAHANGVNSLVCVRANTLANMFANAHVILL